MKVRAVAVGTERSNAIGTVELECTPHGLSIVYLGVGSFTVGYAPGALTVGTHVMVPWPSVVEARVEGDRIFLAIDPEVTPHNRLTMTSFSTGENPHLRELDRQRSMIRIGAVGAALVTALLVSVSVPLAAPRAGALAALVIGALSAVSVLAVGLLAERRLGRPGIEGDAAREALAVELSMYLPNFVRLPHAPMPPIKPIELPALQAFLPRTTFAIVITLTACSLGALLVAGSVLRAREQSDTRRVLPSEPPAADDEQAHEPEPAPQPAQPVSRAPAASAAIVQAASPAPSASAPQSAGAVTGRCSCRRGDSPLWQKPIPLLSTLILSQKVHHELRRKRTELELAAVNNGDKDVNELTIVIQFFDRDPAPSLRRSDVGASSVYFQGPLGPGKAIKWSIEARGSEFEVQPPLPGDIGPVGDGAAPTNMLADLLEANHRPVRLHGAMMLAYLGDPRAKEAVMKLREALREDEAPYLDRVAAAINDVRVCALEVKGSGPVRKLKACAFNASDATHAPSVVRVRALEVAPTHADPVGAPPAVLAESSYPLPELASHAGVELHGDFNLDREESSGSANEASRSAAPVFEAFAE